MSIPHTSLLTSVLAVSNMFLLHTAGNPPPSFACVVRYLPAPHRVHELMPSVAAYLPAGYLSNLPLNPSCSLSSLHDRYL